MRFNCGVVDLPNVGKSTLFNTPTKSGIAAESLPLCTIESNSGTVPMPDARLNALAEIVKPERVLPTTMGFVDIAGLVAGASKGEGLDNKLFANIREIDVITYMVRCFEDGSVIRVSNSVDLKRDIEVVNLGLIFANLGSCEKQPQRAACSVKDGDKEALAQRTLLGKLIPYLAGNKPACSLLKNLGDEEKCLVHSLHLLIGKPVIYIADVAEDGFESNPYLDVMKAIAEEGDAMVVPVYNKIEAEVAELEDGEEKDMFPGSLGLEEPGPSRAIHAGYDLLSLQTYSAVGVKEVRAWTVCTGAIAPRAAGVIHTDFEKGFIRAEVAAYDGFIQFKGEQDAKEAGKWHLEGKNYVVKGDDVMYFRFNV